MDSINDLSVLFDKININVDNDIYLSNVIKIQSLVRRWLVKKNNIYKKFRIDSIKSKFKDEIFGYHLINSVPIKESVWESINCNIVKNDCIVSDCADGNHVSGKDNKFDNWNISNKTLKIEKNGNCKMSSYRLTSVCSNKNTGKKEEIINEIKKRDKSFDYYSILAREENKNKDKITYIWYIIPKSYYLFRININNLDYIRNKKNEIIGWKTNNCNIRFSMSSQLWYNFNKNDIKKFKISEIIVNNSNKKMTYSDILKLVNKYEIK